MVMCLMNLFFTYYTLIFCVIYTKSAKAWFYSAIQSPLIDWFGMGLIIPAGSVAIRILCKNNPKMT
jgi:hypothetical protein